MAAYVIVDVAIKDPETFARYRELVPATLAAYGGRFLARGGKLAPLEGGWTPERVVLLEFPDLDSARRWWASPEYAPAKALRQRSAETRMLAVEGIAP